MAEVSAVAGPVHADAKASGWRDTLPKVILVLAVLGLQAWLYPMAAWDHAHPDAPFYSYLGFRVVALAVGLGATTVLAVLGRWRTSLVVGCANALVAWTATTGFMLRHYHETEVLSYTVAWGLLLLPVARLTGSPGVPHRRRTVGIAVGAWFSIALAVGIDASSSRFWGTWDPLGVFVAWAAGVGVVSAALWVDDLWVRERARRMDAEVVE